MSHVGGLNSENYPEPEEYPELDSEVEALEDDDKPVITTSKDWIVSVLEAKYK